MQSGDRAGLHEAMGSLSNGLTIDPQVLLDWNWIQEDHPGENRWITLNLHPSKADTLVSCSRGTNGYQGMIETINDSTIYFAIVPFLLDGRLRRVFITYAGPSVSVIKKGKLSITKGKVYNSFTGIAGELYLTEREDLDSNILLTKLQKLFGTSASL